MEQYKFVFYNREDENTDRILEVAYIKANSRMQAWVKAEAYAESIGANDFQICD